MNQSLRFKYFINISKRSYIIHFDPAQTSEYEYFVRSDLSIYPISLKEMFYM